MRSALLEWFANTDLVEDGERAARRALKRIRRGVDTAVDLRDEAVHRARRQPLRAAGFIFGAGLLLGAAAALLGRRQIARACK
jgi:hypothetical protein